MRIVGALCSGHPKRLLSFNLKAASSRSDVAPMTTFIIDKHDGKARTGAIYSDGRRLETPALLLYTKRGSPMYLTPDTLEHVDQEAKAFLIDATKL